jgi:hypothetical protein
MAARPTDSEFLVVNPRSKFCFRNIRILELPPGVTSGGQFAPS